MRLKLKDDPREWQKFAIAGAIFLAMISALAWRRSWIPDLAFQLLLGTLATLLIAAWIRPALVRPSYRVAMRFSHALGQVVGRVLLVLCFLLVLTPLALLLRILGRDLMQLKRPKTAESYWKSSRPIAHHDRAF